MAKLSQKLISPDQLMSRAPEARTAKEWSGPPPEASVPVEQVMAQQTEKPLILKVFVRTEKPNEDNLPCTSWIGLTFPLSSQSQPGIEQDLRKAIEDAARQMKDDGGIHAFEEGAAIFYPWHTVCWLRIEEAE